MNNKRAAFLRSDASVLLNLIRGLAAFLVVVGHARNFLFKDYEQLSSHSIWVSIPYLLTKAGHQAVVIFFVLSGYLISGSIFRSIKAGTWSWPSYLTHRLVRLWVVLLPGLLLCAFWDNLALTHHFAPVLYRVGAGNHMSVNVAAQLSLRVFFQNLLFLQVKIGPTFGSNTALWSLPYEFWSYILFPLGLFTFSFRTSLGKRTISVLFLVIVAWFAHVYLNMFPLWLAGAALARVPIPRLGLSVRIAATLIYIPYFFFCAGYSNREALLASDYALAGATTLFLWILLTATKESTPSFQAHVARVLARFSYTLYVVHMPLLLLLTAVTLGDTRWAPTLINLIKAGGLVLAVAFYAYLVARLTEFQTDKLRHWIERVWPLLGSPVLTAISEQPGRMSAASSTLPVSRAHASDTRI